MWIISTNAAENLGLSVSFLPQAQLPADHTGISIRPVRVAHRPPLAIQVNFNPSTARQGPTNQTDCSYKPKQSGVNSAATEPLTQTRPRCGRALVAVAVSPANGARVLPEEAPRIGLAVGVPAVAVVPQAPARVLHDIVWKLCPLQTGGAGVGLGHGAVVIPQLGEPLRAGQRHCSTEGEERIRCLG